MSLLEDIIELRVEIAIQIVDMGGGDRSFLFSRIRKVFDLTSNLLATLKALGNNLPIPVQGLLPQLKIELKKYAAQSHDMRGYYGGIVDLPYKEEKLIKYIDSYADDLEALIKKEPKRPSFEGLTDALAAERLLVKTLMEENEKLYEKINSQDAELADYKDKLSRHDRKGVICIAVDDTRPLSSDELQRTIKGFCLSRDIPYEYASFDPPKYNQFSNRLEISYRY